MNAKRSRAHGEAGQRRRVRGGAASERAHSPSATPAPDAIVQEAGVKRVSVKTYRALPLASHAPQVTKGRRPKKRWAPSNGPEGQVSPRIFLNFDFDGGVSETLTSAVTRPRSHTGLLWDCFLLVGARTLWCMWWFCGRSLGYTLVAALSLFSSRAHSFSYLPFDGTLSGTRRRSCVTTKQILWLLRTSSTRSLNRPVRTPSESFVFVLGSCPPSRFGSVLGGLFHPAILALIRGRCHPFIFARRMPDIEVTKLQSRPGGNH